MRRSRYFWTILGRNGVGMDQVGLLSRLFRFRCTDCNALQPWLRLPLTAIAPNRWDYYNCPSCGTPLFASLSEARHAAIWFFIVLPTFLLAGLIGSGLILEVPFLRHFDETRSHFEPNFLGIILVGIGILIPLSAAAEILGIRWLAKIEAVKGPVT